MYNVSVIIPVYQPDEEFADCIDSLKKQTVNKDFFEVIVVLNGEKNNYEDYVLSIIRDTDLNIQYYYSENKGVSNARNLGIQHSNGEYVCFIDSDDFVSEKYLQGLYSEENDMLLANVKCFWDGEKSLWNDFLGDLYESLKEDKSYSHLRVRSYFSVPWGKLIPRELCLKALFDSRFDYGEDALFMFSIEPFLMRGKKANKDVVYYRRMRNSSLSNKKRSRKELCNIHCILLKEYWSIYIKNFKKYNIIFFLNRNLAILKHIILMK